MKPMNLSTLLYRMRQFAPWALVLVSATVAVTAYLQAPHFPFVIVDGYYISQNHTVRQLRCLCDVKSCLGRRCEGE